VAEPLGLLDRSPLLRVGREKGRVRRQPVELAGDLAGSLNPPPLHLDRPPPDAREAEGAQGTPRDPRPPGGALVGDALLFEHQLRGDARVGGGDDVEARFHAMILCTDRPERQSFGTDSVPKDCRCPSIAVIIGRCSSPSTSATPRPTSGPST